MAYGLYELNFSSFDWAEYRSWVLTLPNLLHTKSVNHSVLVEINGFITVQVLYVINLTNFVGILC